MVESAVVKERVATESFRSTVVPKAGASTISEQPRCHTAQVLAEPQITDRLALPDGRLLMSRAAFVPAGAHPLSLEWYAPVSTTTKRSVGLLPSTYSAVR